MVARFKALGSDILPHPRCLDLTPATSKAMRVCHFCQSQVNANQAIGQTQVSGFLGPQAPDLVIFFIFFYIFFKK